MEYSKVSQTRLLLIDAGLVIGGVVLLACALMRLGEVFLGRPAASWGIPAQEWALGAVCLLVFTGAVCARSLLTAKAPEREADLAAEDAPAAVQIGAGGPPLSAPVSPSPEQAAAEPLSGGARGNALARAAAAEERRQALLRESEERPAQAAEPAAAPAVASASASPPTVEPQEDETPPSPRPATATSVVERKPKPPRLRAVDPGGSFL
ncbi:MAG: hypothetical protein HKP27_14700 [Myxococcales bacterium]|nr:hypothetical protein [Myxococcales bacterium]